MRDQAQVQIVVRHLVDDAAGGPSLPGQALQVAIGQAAGQAGVQALHAGGIERLRGDP